MQIKKDSESGCGIRKGAAASPPLLRRLQFLTKLLARSSVRPPVPSTRGRSRLGSGGSRTRRACTYGSCLPSGDKRAARGIALPLTWSPRITGLVCSVYTACSSVRAPEASHHPIRPGRLSRSICLFARPLHFTGYSDICLHICTYPLGSPQERVVPAT